MLGLAGATGFTYRDVTRRRTTSAQPSELLPVFSLVLVVANVDLVGAAGGVSVRDEVWCTCVDVWEVRVRLVECALGGVRVRVTVSLTPAPVLPELAMLCAIYGSATSIDFAARSVDRQIAQRSIDRAKSIDRATKKRNQIDRL